MGIIGAYIVPHPPVILNEIGGGREKRIQKTIEAYKAISRTIKESAPETIVLISPHQISYKDYFHISPGQDAVGDLGEFGAPQLHFKVEYDTLFVKSLEKELDDSCFLCGTLGEQSNRLDHGSMIPLAFLQKEYTDFKLVRIGLSGQSYLKHYALGEYIRQISEKLNRKTIIVASGDMSHCLMEHGPYGYHKEGPDYDQMLCDALSKGDFLSLLRADVDFCASAMECGHRSFLILAGTLDQKAVLAKFYSYEGPFGVGYGIFSYEPVGEDPDRNFGEQFLQESSQKMAVRKQSEDAYVRLARQAVETFILSGKIMNLSFANHKYKLNNKNKIANNSMDQAETPLYNERAGVFVSLKTSMGLRGCIGTINPVTNCIGEEIIRNAVSAAVHDPRFSPVSEDELSELIYSVDVLQKPEKIESLDLLDPKKYGIIVSNGSKRGLLLPDLSGVDTVYDQISIAKQKAGLTEEDTFQLERFLVERHH